jgi:fumarate reductase flavoprotein subunit
VEGEEIMNFMVKPTVPERASFEVVPPPIPASDIKETVTADVVVLGAGISGLTAALSAAERGAKVVELEKAPNVNFRGMHNAAIASRKQKEAGIKNNKADIISTIMQWSSYRADQRVVKLWADHCDEVMDWLTDLYERKHNKQVVLDPTTKPWYFQNFPLIHVFFPFMEGRVHGWQANLAYMLLDEGKERGVDLRFETPARRLIREGNGRVTGVIAQNKQGGYIQFNTRKAVVLCTGDYGSDHEMVARYCDWRAQALAPSSRLYSDATTNATGLVDGRVNTGDGHKMGMWIGAAIDDPPHCPMYFDRMSIPGAPKLFLKLRMARQPWLYVNVDGRRFMNEDLPWAYEVSQMMQQRDFLSWAVWDDKYEQEWPKMRSQCCKNLGPPTYMHQPEQIPESIEKGSLLTAKTIEDLAKKMEVPVRAFTATVARYNKMAQRGEDLDFGKHPDRLTTVEKPPFYACRMSGTYLVILGGLKINNKTQVLDTENKPIPGLYAAGNVSGSFFGDMYPTTLPGLSHSRAFTFGRLAGLAAAAVKV